MLNQYESVQCGDSTRKDKQLLSWQWNIINEVNFISLITLCIVGACWEIRYKSRCINWPTKLFPSSQFGLDNAKNSASVQKALRCMYLLQSLFVTMMLSSQAGIQIGSLKMGEIKRRRDSAALCSQGMVYFSRF